MGSIIHIKGPDIDESLSVPNLTPKDAHFNIQHALVGTSGIREISCTLQDGTIVVIPSKVLHGCVITIKQLQSNNYNQMKKVNLLLSALLICAFSFVACDKQNAEPLSKYDSYIEKYSATDELVTEPTVHEVIDEIMKTGLWDQKTVKYALTCDCTPDEKLEMLEHGASRNISEETGLETIARKNTGSVNVNGGQAYWDCSPSLLAQTISQVGTGVDPRAVNNFYNAGSSVNTITMSDVLRAANGVNNTAFDGIIEVADIVFENEVSGGNWLVGAVIVVDGIEYVYSDFTGTNGSLIYDPQDGGAYLIGPMPGGITSIDITGQWTPPLSN